MSDMTGRLTGISSTVVFPLELGPRPLGEGVQTSCLETAKG